MGLLGKGKQTDEVLEERSNDAIQQLIATRNESETSGNDGSQPREDEDLPTAVSVDRTGQSALDGLDDIPAGQGPVAGSANNSAANGDDVENPGEPAKGDTLDDDLLDLFKDEDTFNEELARLAELLDDVDIDLLRKEVQEIKVLLQRE